MKNLDACLPKKVLNNSQCTFNIMNMITVLIELKINFIKYSNFQNNGFLKSMLRKWNVRSNQSNNHKVTVFKCNLRHDDKKWLFDNYCSNSQVGKFQCCVFIKTTKPVITLQLQIFCPLSFLMRLTSCILSQNFTFYWGKRGINSRWKLYVQSIDKMQFFLQSSYSTGLSNLRSS